jgi:hypothetical protein
MNKTLFLIPWLILILALGGCNRHSAVHLHSCDIAARHAIVLDKPAVNFFEGAVLGNGGMGVVARTYPDAVAFHFGHNNVWDIRLAENNREKIGTFDQIMEKAKKLSPDLKYIDNDKAFRDYQTMTRENYRKPYPRPFPCGTVLLNFDIRTTEMLGHVLDISTGTLRIFLLHNGKIVKLEAFADMTADRLWFRLVDEHDRPIPPCFVRFRVIPDGRTPREFPQYSTAEEDSLLAFTQILPGEEPEKYNKETGSPRDRAFRLEARINAPLEAGVHYNTLGIADSLGRLEKYFAPSEIPFVGCIALNEGSAKEIKQRSNSAPDVSMSNFDTAQQESHKIWHDFWDKSAVLLADKELEDIWYRNLYFLNCSARPGYICPGLFANWSFGDIGTAWHGDYHMNYNTQQPFWVTFSSNHIENNLPYVEMVHHLLPVSRRWAKDYYGMRGAFFPHSAYPVDMTLHPYPAPDWGWEVFETPWTVQGLWWHYLYSQDEDFLRNHAWEPVKDAVMFLVDYMKRPDAHGSNRWNDSLYHIFPSVPPELYGLQPGFRFNYDTQADLALTRFIFKAFLEAATVLQLDGQEANLISDVNTILAAMPDYSTTESENFGTIYTSVPGENDRMVYNCPANLIHVFPGEQYGLNAPEDVRERLLNTLRAHRNEGGNDLVALNMIAARLGALDIERFKRQVHYSTLPNGTEADMVMQTGGRYGDLGDYAFMAPMGIWFENFALPAVINECLMQSYDGTIRLFPNWNRNTDAIFQDLRAAGAFLVSCSLRDGDIATLTVFSEKGKTCRMVNPFGFKKIRLIRNGKAAETLEGELLEFQTKEGETIEVKQV